MDKLQTVGAGNCHISEVTYAELLYGVKMSRLSEQNMNALKNFVGGVDVIPISEVLEQFADIKVQLRKIGKPVDDADIFIGATAIANGMVMVTENTRHFENMPGIRLENWVRRP